MTRAADILIRIQKKRIAELEAELASMTERWRNQFARAESECKRRYACEAEVERLRAENHAMWEALGRPLSVEEVRR